MICEDHKHQMLKEDCMNVQNTADDFRWDDLRCVTAPDLADPVLQDAVIRIVIFAAFNYFSSLVPT